MKLSMVLSSSDSELDEIDMMSMPPTEMTSRLDLTLASWTKFEAASKDVATAIDVTDFIVPLKSPFLAALLGELKKLRNEVFSSITWNDVCLIARLNEGMLCKSSSH